MKKSIFKILTVIFITSLLFEGCQKENIVSENVNPELNNNEVVSSNSEEIILGEQIGSTYSVNNIKLAYQKLGLKSKSDNLHPNRLYVKLLPENAEDVEAIENDSSLFIFDFPLDYEILQYGDFYIEPEIIDTFLNPRYTYVKSVEEIPVEQYQIVDELYLPSENETKLEIMALILKGEIDVPQNYDTLEYVDYYEEKGGYYPEGKIKVYNTVTGQYVGVKNIKVYFHATDATASYTGSDGYFKASRKYYSKVNVYARFENSDYIVRYYWDEFIDIGEKNYIYKLSSSSNNKTYNINTGSEKLWNKATIVCALQKYKSYCSTVGIYSSLYNRNIWILPTSNKNFTPLFRSAGIIDRTVPEAIRDFFGILLPGYFTDKILAFIGFYPDIILSKSTSTQTIDLAVFKQCSNNSHFTMVGNYFWNNLISAEVSNRITQGNIYGDGTKPNTTKAQYIALAESWACFMEKKIGIYYGYRFNLESFQPRTIPYSFTNNQNIYLDSWIPVGVYEDILDNTPIEVVELKDQNGVRQDWDEDEIMVHLTILSLV